MMIHLKQSIVQLNELLVINELTSDMLKNLKISDIKYKYYYYPLLPSGFIIAINAIAK